MIMYIELVLFVNVLIHVLTILIIKQSFFLKIKKSFFFTIFLDIVYMLMYVYGVNISIFKYLLPAIFVLLSFRINFYLYVKSVFLYYIISFSLGGISTTLKISGNSGYLLILTLYFIIFVIFYYLLNRKELFITYKLKFYFLNKKYSLNAFFDTGCNLMYKGFNVIILNSKYDFNIYSNEKLTIKTAAGYFECNVYKLNNLIISKRKIDCYCVFLDIDYEAIIGVNLILN